MVCPKTSGLRIGRFFGSNQLKTRRTDSTPSSAAGTRSPSLKDSASAELLVVHLLHVDFEIRSSELNFSDREDHSKLVEKCARVSVCELQCRSELLLWKISGRKCGPMQRLHRLVLVVRTPPQAGAVRDNNSVMLNGAQTVQRIQNYIYTLSYCLYNNNVSHNCMYAKYVYLRQESRHTGQRPISASSLTIAQAIYRAAKHGSRRSSR